MARGFKKTRSVKKWLSRAGKRGGRKSGKVSKKCKGKSKSAFHRCRIKHFKKMRAKK